MGGRTGGESSSTGGRTGGDPHQRDPQCRDHQALEMVFCSSEMEMKSKIGIIIKTGFRPL